MPDDSALRCGASCTVCPAPAPGSNQVATCTQGVCGTRCQATCDGGCVEPLSDSQNCGGCGVVCAPGTRCLDGHCAAACQYDLNAARSTPVRNELSMLAGDVDGDGRSDAVFAGSVALSRFDAGVMAFLVRDEAAIQVPVAVADFTRDGRADVISSNGAVLLFHQSTGSGFLAPTVLHASPAPLAVGDFDGVNGPDVVLADQNAVTVLRNDGTGVLQARPPTSLTSTVLSLSVGDLNADGRRDVLVIRTGASNVAEALIGDGVGGFTVGPTRLIPNGMTARLNDVGSDLRDELLVESATSGSTVYSYTPTAWTLGSGFAVPGYVNTRSTDGGVLVCTASGVISCSDELNSTEVSFAGTSKFALADVTGDGVLDILAISRDAGLAAAIRVGDQLRVATPTWSHEGSPAFPDINGDGLLDVVARTNELTAALALTNERFGAPQLLFDAGVPVQSVAAIDLDGDAFGDVGALITDANPAAVLWRGSSTGQLLPAGRIPLVDESFRPLSPSSLSGLLTHDYDGDGTRDVFVKSSAGLYWSRAIGSGLYGPPRFLFLGTAVFGDLNGDGRKDIVRVLTVAGSTLGSVELNAGGGLYVQWQSLTLPVSASRLEVRDLNADGKLDVDMGRMIFFGLGNGTLAPTATLVTDGVHVDLNRDGFVDTATVDGRVILGGPGPTTTYLLNDGAPSSVWAMDRDHDGLLDLVWAGTTLSQPQSVCR